MILNADKLDRMLRTTEDVLDASRSCRAGDLHDLVKLHEARNVATCSGVVYRSALDRTESREQFFREDFPMTDPSWFCWHGATLSSDGNVVFDRQDVPDRRRAIYSRHARGCRAWSDRRHHPRRVRRAGAAMSEPTEGTTGGKLAINLETCTGCSLCVLACPVDVIRMDASDRQAGDCLSARLPGLLSLRG